MNINGGFLGIRRAAGQLRPLRHHIYRGAVVGVRGAAVGARGAVVGVRGDNIGMHSTYVISAPLCMYCSSILYMSQLSDQGLVAAGTRVQYIKPSISYPVGVVSKGRQVPCTCS